MSKRKKQEWLKETLELKEDHNWKSKPGTRIFVAGRGAVRFDVRKIGILNRILSRSDLRIKSRRMMIVVWRFRLICYHLVTGQIFRWCRYYRRWLKMIREIRSLLGKLSN